MAARAVVFDLDGVLADSAAVVEATWRRWAGEERVPIDEVLAVCHGRPARDVVAMFRPDGDVAEHEARLTAYEVAGSTGLRPVPGAHECVALARRWAWAIATSGGRELATSRLEAVGVAPPPPVLVTADDVTRGKPDPEPYLRAAEGLALPPAACVVVEDAPAGIAAARAAGMCVVAVATTHTPDALAEADVVVEGMHAARDELARRLRPAA